MLRRLLFQSLHYVAVPFIDASCSFIMFITHQKFFFSTICMRQSRRELGLMDGRRKLLLILCFARGLRVSVLLKLRSKLNKHKEVLGSHRQRTAIAIQMGQAVLWRIIAQYLLVSSNTKISFSHRIETCCFSDDVDFLRYFILRRKTNGSSIGAKEGISVT